MLQIVGSTANRRILRQRLCRHKSVLAEAIAAVTPGNSNAQSSAYKRAIDHAARVVQPERPISDPFSLVSSEMSTLARNIGSIVGSGHPTLNKVAMYYFQSEGKHVRPLIVLLLSKALSEIPVSQRDRIAIDLSDSSQSKLSVDDPLSSLEILNGVTPNAVLNPLSRPLDPFPSASNGILPKQRRLAEIVEMIHTASLLHDDVIDNSDSRRGLSSGNIAFGNKMAILAGDFLLGRASVAIARIRNAEVTELISTTIANLVEGEFMQLENTALASDPNTAQDIVNEATFEYYIHKTYLKTASLMSKSCRSAAVLSGARDPIVEMAYQYGKNLGLCFQIVDDMLDYTVSESELGKPAGADLKLGLATAPVLYAWREFEEVGELIKRKFKEPGDVEAARRYVEMSNGLEKTRDLAVKFHNEAQKQLDALPDSEALHALRGLTSAILDRKK